MDINLRYDTRRRSDEWELIFKRNNADRTNSLIKARIRRRSKAYRRKIDKILEKSSVTCVDKGF